MIILFVLQTVRCRNCRTFFQEKFKEQVRRLPHPHHGACANQQPKKSGGKQGLITLAPCCPAMWFQRRTASTAHLLPSFAAETACQRSGCVWIVTSASMQNSHSITGSPALMEYTSPLTQQSAVCKRMADIYCSNKVAICLFCSKKIYFS